MRVSMMYGAGADKLDRPWGHQSVWRHGLEARLQEGLLWSETGPGTPPSRMRTPGSGPALLCSLQDVSSSIDRQRICGIFKMGQKSKSMSKSIYILVPGSYICIRAIYAHAYTTSNTLGYKPDLLNSLSFYGGSRMRPKSLKVQLYDFNCSTDTVEIIYEGLEGNLSALLP